MPLPSALYTLSSALCADLLPPIPFSSFLLRLSSFLPSAIEDAYRVQVDVDNEMTYIDIIGKHALIYIYLRPGLIFRVDTAGPEEYSALRDQYIQMGAVCCACTFTFACECAYVMRCMVQCDIWLSTFPLSFSFLLFYSIRSSSALPLLSSFLPLPLLLSFSLPLFLYIFSASSPPPPLSAFTLLLLPSLYNRDSSSCTASHQCIRSTPLLNSETPFSRLRLCPRKMIPATMYAPQCTQFCHMHSFGTSVTHTMCAIG